MKIIVAGCGKIGSSILANLVGEGHDVTAIDNDPAVIEQLTNVYDVMGVCGNTADPDTLNEANAASAQLFVAVSGSDEMNMLSCFLAKRMGAQYTIARIRNPEYNDQSIGLLRQELDISLTVNPELLTARELFNILKFPSAVKVENFSRRNLEMVEIRLEEGTELDGVQIFKMREKYKAQYLVCAVTRGDDVVIPDGSFTLKAGDKIGLIASPVEITKLLRMLGVLRKKASSVMILGGSKTTYYLAKMLESAGVDVKIIEKNLDRCEHLGAHLPKSVIINGDGAQQELLLEEGLRTLDAFVALTGMDEQNMIISMFAQMQKVPTVISKINREEMSVMASKLGLDCVITPKDITSNIIVRCARALQNSMGSNVETLYKIMDGRAEALEFNVREDFAATGVSLKEMQLKKNILIAGIMRGRKTIIPSGDDAIHIGDRVIVLASGQRLNDLSDILR